MRHDRLGIILLLLTLDAPPAQAQQGSGAERPLSETLRVGQNVLVHNADGETTRGRVLVVTDDQVALATRRRTGFLWTLQDTNETFSADSIQAINAVDSGWNGAVIGAVSGVAALWWFAEHGPEVSGEAVAFFILPIPVWSTVAGWTIDQQINNTRLWDRSTSTITFAPVFGAQRLGLTARVRF